MKEVGFDYFTGHALDTPTLAGAVSQGLSSTGHNQLQVLGFDACLMSSFELCYEVRSLTKIVLASLNKEPNDGWPYTGIIQHYLQTDRWDAVSFGKSVVKSYVESYRSRQQMPNAPVTLSAIPTSCLTGLAEAIDALAQRCLTALRHPANPTSTSFEDAFSKARRRTDTFYGHCVDLRSFAEELLRAVEQRGVDVPEVIDSARTVVSEIEANIFEEHWSTDSFPVSDNGGLSIWFPAFRPSDYTFIRTAYENLRFWKEHRVWMELLDVFLNL